MKKILAIVLAALLIVAALAGCAAKSETADTSADTAAEPAADAAASDDSAASGELEVIKVGASSTPHAEILEQVKDTLAAEGYDLQTVVYDDYVLPNQSLADGSLDANYFQHTPYLNSFNAANGTDLVSAAKIHYEPFGLYGNGVDSVADIAADATILIPAAAQVTRTAPRSRPLSRLCSPTLSRRTSKTPTTVLSLRSSKIIYSKRPGSLIRGAFFIRRNCTRSRRSLRNPGRKIRNRTGSAGWPAVLRRRSRSHRAARRASALSPAPHRRGRSAL